MKWVEGRTFDHRAITRLMDDGQVRDYGHYERLGNGTFALPARQGKRARHTTSEADIREEIASRALALAFEDMTQLARMVGSIPERPGARGATRPTNEGKV